MICRRLFVVWLTLILAFVVRSEEIKSCSHANENGTRSSTLCIIHLSNKAIHDLNLSWCDNGTEDINRVQVSVFSRLGGLNFTAPLNSTRIEMSNLLFDYDDNALCGSIVIDNSMIMSVEGGRGNGINNDGFIVQLTCVGIASDDCSGSISVEGGHVVNTVYSTTVINSLPLLEREQQSDPGNISVFSTTFDSDNASSESSLENEVQAFETLKQHGQFEPTLQISSASSPQSFTIQARCGIYSTGVCSSGYYQISSDIRYWSCGKDCPGGTYYTDSTCHCICKTCPEILAAKPTSSPTTMFSVPSLYQNLAGYSLCKY